MRDIREPEPSLLASLVQDRAEVVEAAAYRRVRDTFGAALRDVFAERISCDRDRPLILEKRIYRLHRAIALLIAGKPCVPTRFVAHVLDVLLRRHAEPGFP